MIMKLGNNVYFVTLTQCLPALLCHFLNKNVTNKIAAIPPPTNIGHHVSLSLSPHGRKPISVSSVPEFEQRWENELRAFIQVKKEKLKIVPLP